MAAMLASLRRGSARATASTAYSTTAGLSGACAANGKQMAAMLASIRRGSARATASAAYSTTAGIRRKIYAIGTMDSKGEELSFLAEQIKRTNAEVVLVDVSAKIEGTARSQVSMDMVLKGGEAAVTSMELASMGRAEAISAMSAALTTFLVKEHAANKVAGVIGIGGSGGSALIAPAMRALPIGVPKVMVSTVASGNTKAYVGTSDLIMVPSVVDVAGLNAVSRRILSNAAHALSGMVAGPASLAAAQPSSTTVGLTMFGVTTPLVDSVRKRLEEAGMDTLVFHATGTGGAAMEELVTAGMISGVLDLSTTEVADHIVGGVMACGAARFEATIKAKVPLLISVGALDMVNFGARDTVPAEFAERNLFVHNSEVTLMRTTKEENIAAAKFIAQKVNAAEGPVHVMLPEKGVSLLDISEMPFFDPQATGALLSTLESEISTTPSRTISRLPLHINDAAFADAVADKFLLMMAAHAPAREAKNKIAPSPSSSPSPPLATFKSLPLDESTPRGKVLTKLRAAVARGEPIIGGGAGTGISAKCEEDGGADLIVIYNSGRFRMAGRGSLAGLMPYADANEVVMSMASEVLPVVKDVPVLAGVCGTDPFRDMGRFLKQVQEAGFCGVQNFPTVGLIDGVFRQNLEETGMGFGLEVEMIRKAAAMGLLTTPYAFDAEQSAAMAAAGADIVVAHVGLTTSGSIGASTALTLQEATRVVQSIASAALAVNPDVLVLCHGGPIAAPADAQYVLANTRGLVHGFYGASSMERLPVEVAITECVRAFKQIKLA